MYMSKHRARDWFVQFLFLAVLVSIAIGAVLQTRAGLEAQGSIAGFTFLSRSTGWDIGFSVLPFTPNDTYGRALLIGFLNTIALGVIGVVLASIVGFTIGLMRVSAHGLVRLIGTLYVECFRNVPLILQLFLYYAVLSRLPSPRNALALGEMAFASNRGFYLPWPEWQHPAIWLAFLGIGALVWAVATGRQNRLWLAVAVGGVSAAVAVFWDAPLFDVPARAGLNFKGGLRLSPELSALALAMGIYGGAYIAEVVRAGFNTVPKGVSEAGISLGMRPLPLFLKVRWPLALRAMLPTLANQYIWLIKATTLGIAIGFTDFFMVVSTSINQSGQTIELIGILMGGFLLLNFTLARLMNIGIKRMKIPGLGEAK
ncbi:MAG: ABC transporter permease subunit [Pseudomonadota bacterium]